jgi:hypothetical protein
MVAIGIVAIVAIVALNLYRKNRNETRAAAVASTRNSTAPVSELSQQQKIKYAGCVDQANDEYRKNWLKACAVKTGPWLDQKQALPYQSGANLNFQHNDKVIEGTGKKSQNEGFCQLSADKIEPIKQKQIEQKATCEYLLGRPLSFQ